jgi:hypothetical protein
MELYSFHLTGRQDGVSSNWKVKPRARNCASRGKARESEQSKVAAASAVGEAVAAFRSAYCDDRTVTFCHDKPNFMRGSPAVGLPRMIASSNVIAEQAEEGLSRLQMVCSSQRKRRVLSRNISVKRLELIG